MDVSARAVLTAALAALVAVAAFVGEVPLVVVVGVLTLALAAGWPALLGLPSPVGSAVVVALGGAGAVMTVTATAGQPLLRHVPVVAGMAVLGAFVHELARRDGRLRLVESITGTVTGLLVVISAAGWVAAGRTPGGMSLVVTAAASLAVAAVVSAVHLAGWSGALVTTGAAVVAGAGVGAVMPDVGVVPGAVLGLATGVLVAALHVLLDGVRSLERRLAALGAVILPVLVAGVLAYVVGRVLVG